MVPRDSNISFENWWFHFPYLLRIRMVPWDSNSPCGKCWFHEIFRIPCEKGDSARLPIFPPKNYLCSTSLANLTESRDSFAKAFHEVRLFAAELFATVDSLSTRICQGMFFLLAVGSSSTDPVNLSNTCTISRERSFSRQMKLFSQ